MFNSPLGRGLGSVISKMSRTSLSERKRSESRSPEKENQELQLNTEKKKEGPEKKEQADTTKKEMPAAEKTGWTYRLTRPFMKSKLTTPDFEKGF